jgi:hypothetical protein
MTTLTFEDTLINNAKNILADSGVSSCVGDFKHIINEMKGEEIELNEKAIIEYICDVDPIIERKLRSNSCNSRLLFSIFNK